MEIISSHSNPKIKLARSLYQRKARQESGLFLVEGIHPVGEAVAAAISRPEKIKLEYLLYAPDLLASQYAQQLVTHQAESGVPTYAVTQPVFEKLAEKENPTGLLAVLRQPAWHLDELDGNNFSWGVALVTPQDPGNIGTILRTIDAVAASGLILLEGGADPYHPGAVRASMGNVCWFPLVQTSFSAFSAWAARGGYHLYGTSARGDHDYREISPYQRPSILLLGSERQGLSAQQAAACERLVRLPMQGRASSLNLAVAAGVMLYAMQA